MLLRHERSFSRTFVRIRRHREFRTHGTVFHHSVPKPMRDADPATTGTTAYVLESQLSATRGPPPAKPFKATGVEVGKP